VPAGSSKATKRQFDLAVAAFCSRKTNKFPEKPEDMDDNTYDNLRKKSERWLKVKL